MAENYKNLKVKELQDLLQKNGLPHSGKKEELIERLVKHDEERAAQELASLEEEFGDLEEFDDSKINLEEIPESEFTHKEGEESTEKQQTTTEQKDKKEAEEKPKEAPVTKPNSNFKFTPIVFDKKPTTAVTPVTTTTSTATPQPAAAAAAAAAAPTIIKGSEEDKRAERAKRFGIQLNESAKKDIRAHRFGLPEKTQPVAVDKKAAKLGVDPDVLKKRAERFGSSADKPAAGGAKAGTVLSAEDEEKKRKRAERFSLDAKKQKVD